MLANMDPISRIASMRPLVVRPRLEQFVGSRLAKYPIVAVLGARQTGKTHLAKRFASSPAHHFDLEKSVQTQALEDNVFSILDRLEGTVVIDEVQELPSIFPALRVLADREQTKARFVITGSVSPRIIHGISESLAGRVITLEMGGFDLEEIGTENVERLWLRGGHPPSFLDDTDAGGMEWRLNSYLEQLFGRDLRIWSNLSLHPAQSRKLMTLIADCSGRSWNHSAAASLLGVDVKTIQRYVDVLEAAYLIRLLPPFEANIRKRLRKAPTIHLRDSGILHALLGIETRERLEIHPRMGQSWESFCVDQIIRLTETRPEHCFTFSVQSGQEIDLILDRPDGRYGFEIKTSENSRPKPADRELAKALELKALHQVRRGNGLYDLGDGLFATGIEELPAVCAAIRGM
jgi:predicted AAA+ superfamily ATPase